MNNTEYDQSDVKNCIRNFHEAFDPGKKCLGKDWRINVLDKEFEQFIKDLTPDKRRFLARLLIFFICYMRPLYKTYDDKIYGDIAWSNFSLVIIMSVLDKYSKGLDYKRRDFVKYLEENLPIIEINKLKTLSEQHRKNEPATPIKRFSSLFKKTWTKTKSRKLSDLI